MRDAEAGGGGGKRPLGASAFRPRRPPAPAWETSVHREGGGDRGEDEKRGAARHQARVMLQVGRLPLLGRALGFWGAFFCRLPSHSGRAGDGPTALPGKKSV